MTIQKLFAHLGLPQKEIDFLLWEMRNYNYKHPKKQVPVLELKDEMDTLLINQIPFICRAIAKVRGDDFLDGSGLFPLSIEENAMLYAAHQLDKYYKSPKTRKNERHEHP